MITATLSPSAKGTTVRVATDLSVTGRLAQFDHKELGEAFNKLVAEFARNLESTLAPAVKAEVEADVASYKAEIDGEIASDLVEAGKEAVSEKLDSHDAARDRGSYAEDDWLVDHPIAKRESLIRRLAPYLTVAGVFLIARIVVYSLRRRRR